MHLIVEEYTIIKVTGSVVSIDGHIRVRHISIDIWANIFCLYYVAMWWLWWLNCLVRMT